MLQVRPSGGLDPVGQWIPGPHGLAALRDIRSRTPQGGGGTWLSREALKPHLSPLFSAPPSGSHHPGDLVRGPEGKAPHPPPPISPRGHQRPGETTPGPEGGSRVTAGAHPLRWMQVSGSSGRGQARCVPAEPGDRPSSLLRGPPLRCRKPA